MTNTENNVVSEHAQRSAAVAMEQTRICMALIIALNNKTTEE